MNQIYIIEEASWLPSLGMLVFLTGAIMMGYRTFVILRVVRLFSSAAKDSSGFSAAGITNRRVEMRKMLSRVGLTLSWMFIALLFHLNAFGWFRSLEISGSNLKLSYCWPKPSVVIPCDSITDIKTVVNRNSQAHLVISVNGKGARRSIATDQRSLIEEISLTLQMRVKNGI